MRGVVLDVKNGRAVVFRKDGDVTEIKDNGYRIGQTINIPIYSYYRKITVLAACFMLVFITGVSGYAVAYRIPSGYIYVDINPSMRLDVNCFDKVISIDPLNEDAEELAESCPLRAADAEECIEKIISACREKEHLNDINNDIELDVVTNKARLNNRVHTVSEKLQKDNWKVCVRNVDKEENRRAMKYRTSPKRLKAVEAYTNAFGGIIEDNFAALKGTTNREIYAELAAAGYTSEAGSENDIGQTQNRKYTSSPERLKAVKEYTDMFGGSLEENMKALKGIGTQEIYAATESRTPIASD